MSISHKARRFVVTGSVGLLISSGLVASPAGATVIYPPLPVVNVHVSEMSASSLTLAWGAPDWDGGATVTAIGLDYKRAGTSAWTDHVDLAGDATSVTLTGLNRGNAYEYRISTQNSAGTGWTGGGFDQMVAAGAGYMCTIVDAGKVMCAGAGTLGQLGDSLSTSRTRMKATDLPAAAVAIASGPNHTCAVLQNTTVYCWGEDADGQLGDFSTSPRGDPVQVQSLVGAVSVALGAGHSCALMSDGTARCWGRNTSGQLGDGSQTTTSEARLVVDANDDPVTGIVQIAASGDSTCAVLVDHSILCWGDVIGRGQLSNPESVSAGSAVTITLGGGHVCALLVDGTVKCWGRGTEGQLGNGTNNSETPLTVLTYGGAPLSNVVSITAGSQHTCAVLDDKSLRCWGDNTHGTLGDGTTTGNSAAVTVTGLPGVVGAYAQSDHTCANTVTGVTYCWGSNGSGEMGDGTTADWLRPLPATGVHVAGSPAWAAIPYTLADRVGSLAVSAHTGTEATLSWTSPSADGGSAITGLRAQYRRLGDSTWHDAGASIAADATEATVAGLTPGATYKFRVGTVNIAGVNWTVDGDSVPVTAGYRHTCAVKADATVWCWGQNQYGQVGNDRLDQVNPRLVAGLPPVASVAAGMNHTCANTLTGTVYCWGRNSRSQLGDGTMTDSDVPVLVQGLSEVSGIAAGEDHTCAVRSDGTVACWGSNDNGQNGVNGNTSLPTVVEGLIGVASLTAGSFHTCAVMIVGTIKCWGFNGNGELGNGTTDSNFVPSTVRGISGAVQVASKGYHTCAITAAGAVKCWGSNYTLALGTDAVDHSSIPLTMASIAGATSITTGNAFTCVTLAAGSAACWGVNDYGQLGAGSTGQANANASDVAGIGNAISVSAGGAHACAALNTGELKCWGANGYGQLGNGTTTTDGNAVLVTEAGMPVPVTVRTDSLSSRVTHVHVTSFTPTTVTLAWNAPAVGLGSSATSIKVQYRAARDATWLDFGAPLAADATTLTLTSLHGSSRYQFRVGATNAVGTTWSDDSSGSTLVAGAGHTCSLRETGTVSCWGHNDKGQLGIESTVDSGSASEVVGLSNVTQVSSSAQHVCAVTTEGTVSCWGRGDGFQLGTTARQQTAPVQVTSESGVVQVAAGEHHTCVVLASGGVDCWGHNYYGERGDDRTAAYASPDPVSVAGINSAIAVATGTNHTCALLRDGSVWCWGRDTDGQIGSQVNSSTSIPVQIAGVEDAVAISAGDKHTCALLASGAISCWGKNTRGQTGTGTVSDRATPALVGGIGAAVAVAAGGEHTCAILIDSSVVCWGAGDHGQLGANSTADALLPVHVAAVGHAAAIAAGPTHTCATTATGLVHCWGDNEYGQLGDGGTDTQLTPVQVSTLDDAAAHVVQVPYSAPTSVRRLNATEITGTAVSLAWLAPYSDGGFAVTHMHVQYRLATDSTWTTYGPALAADALTVTVDGLTQGSVYRFRVGVETLGGTTWSSQATESSIATGVVHTCLIVVDGVVKCVGSNASGQLGDPAATSSSTPELPSPAVSVAAGSSHTCAVLANGTVACWGANSDSQLGDGTTIQRDVPTVVPGLQGVVAVTAGDRHTCALIVDGTALCWGYNGQGQLGDATTTDRSTPSQVYGLIGAVGIEAGSRNTCALFADGTAKCWGDLPGLGTSSSPVTLFTAAASLSLGNGQICAVQSDATVRCLGAGGKGQLGSGSAASSDVPVTVVKADGTPLTDVVQVAAGGEHTCAVVTAGAVWCWGSNEFGQGVIGATDPIPFAMQVPGVSGVDALATGFNHTCAGTVISDIYCWGENGSGQLNTGDFSYVALGVIAVASSRPDPVTALTATAASGTSVNLSWTESANDGSSSLTKIRVQYRLARATTWTDFSTPLLPTATATTVTGLTRGSRYQFRVGVANARGTTWSLDGGDSAAIAGAFFNCALRRGGTVDCWGDNFWGQLGNGTTNNSSTPVGVSTLHGAVGVAAGATHACALLSVGTVECWGANFDKQLGAGNDAVLSSNTPVPVSGLSDVVSISAGRYHTCAVISDGTVSCWGYNANGQLGRTTIGTADGDALPVAGLAGAVSVAGGVSHTCALMAGGTVKCWGDGSSGRLGGTPVDGQAIVDVAGLTGVIKITSSVSHTCALLSDGAVKCWGYNGYGQLGDGTTTDASTPVQVAGLTPALAVSAGSESTCAIVQSGATLCWGNNSVGQLGDGTVVDKHAPTVVAGLSDAAALNTGDTSTCAVTRSGTSACWGNSAAGALGVPGTSNSLTPVTASFVDGAAPVWETPAVAPSAVTAVTAAIVSSTSLTVNWTAPTDDGGKPVTDYDLSYSIDSGANWFGYPDPVSTATTATLSGLGTGATYIVRIRAINEMGMGAAGLSNSVFLTNGLNPTFATPTKTTTGFTVQVTNYSSVYTWAATVPAGSGTASINNAGLVTVKGVTAGPTTLLVTTTRKGFSSGRNSVTSAALPAVSSFSPTGTVQPGVTVVVTGTNLWGATEVSVGTTSITRFTLTSPTTLVFGMPRGATSGKVTVVTPSGSAQSAASITVGATNTAPGLASRNPLSVTSGRPGTAILVTGTNLGSVTSVALRGTSAAFTVLSATQLVAAVPASAVTGTWTFTSAGGTVTSASFTVSGTALPPTITSKAQSAKAGTIITLAGTNIGGVTSLTVNGLPSGGYTVTGIGGLTLMIPADATKGVATILVTTPGGTVSLANVTVT